MREKDLITEISELEQGLTQAKIDILENSKKKNKPYTDLNKLLSNYNIPKINQIIEKDFKL